MKRKYFYSGVLLLALSVLLLLPVGIAQAKYAATLTQDVTLTLNISGGYTVTFELTDVTGDLFVKMNDVIPSYELGPNAEKTYINVKTIEFRGTPLSQYATSKSWNIGTSEGSRDIGTISFQGTSTNVINYTLTADTTFYITETTSGKPSIGEKPSIDEKPSTTSKTLSIQSKGGTITGTQTTTSNEEG